MQQQSQLLKLPHMTMEGCEAGQLAGGFTWGQREKEAEMSSRSHHMIELIVVSVVPLWSELSLPQTLGSFELAGHSKCTQ